jgi:hypothetical protein
VSGPATSHPAATFSDVIGKLGFAPPTPVQSLHSIAHLFGTTKSRCGIYLLVFNAPCFYIGKAKDVVRRFSQHRRVHDDISAFSFMPMAQSDLDMFEQETIFAAEQLGMPLSNAVHVSNIQGDTDLDLIVPRFEQEQWYDSRRKLAVVDHSQRISLPDVHLLRFAKHYARFQKHPLCDTVEGLLRDYVCNCLPFPARTEFSFWSVSCMPSTNSSTSPRLICVNLAVMEVFVIGYHKGEPNKPWAFVIMALDVLEKEWRSWEKFHSEYPLAELYESHYRDAGQHQCRVETDDIATLQRLLRDPRVVLAASALTLRLMRKRASMFSKFHCKQLADAVFRMR